MTRKILGTICLLVLVVILVAGLWPFHAPKNEVSWLKSANGLQFGEHGSIATASAFKGNPQNPNGSCSLEIWLQPKRVDNSGTGMILAFYQPESGVVPFSMRQYHDGLVLQSATRDNLQIATRDINANAVYADHVFKRDRPVLVTITSTSTGTALYADGALVRKFADFWLSSQALTGRLVIGNSPVTSYSWSGQVEGLALYRRQLLADEISQDLTNWIKSEHLDVARKEGVAALYLFNEGIGSVVHNQVNSTTDLLIAERFFVLHEQFLERPWDEYRPGWRYWKNIGVNIVGFIPLGLFFCAYLSLVQKGNGITSTILLGFAVSFTIEVLQAFLPTRDSGMTDLITNTLGTIIGVMVFRHKRFQAIFAFAS